MTVRATLGSDPVVAHAPQVRGDGEDRALRRSAPNDPPPLKEGARGGTPGSPCDRATLGSDPVVAHAPQVRGDGEDRALRRSAPNDPPPLKEGARGGTLGSPAMTEG